MNTTNDKDLIGKEFNVRILFDKDGGASVGWVQGFHKVDSNCVDFMPASQEVIEQICGTLGLKQRQISKVGIVNAGMEQLFNGSTLS